MQGLCMPQAAALDCHPGQNQISQTPAARQLLSGKPRRTQRPDHAQPCKAFLPWQRQQQPAPLATSSPQPQSAQLPVPDASQPQDLQKHAALRAAETPAGPAEGALGLPAPAEPADVPEATLPPGPVIAGSGGGIFFFWQLGVIKYLSQVYDLTAVQFRGASAGALVSTLAACSVSPDAALTAAYELALDYGIFERPMGLVGVWGGLVRAWLDALLPEDAHERCSGRVKLVVTELPSLRQVYVDDFATKAELVDACMASAHIPFFLDGRPAAQHRGRWYVDGSLQDFVFWRNSELLTCGGSAFIVDYSMDELLKYERLDFVKLRGLEEVRELMSLGFNYAQRQEEAGVLEAHFGDFRRKHWPGWRPSEVPSDLESFLQRISPSLASLRPQLASLSNALPWSRKEEQQIAVPPAESVSEGGQDAAEAPGSWGRFQGLSNVLPWTRRDDASKVASAEMTAAAATAVQRK